MIDLKYHAARRIMKRGEVVVVHFRVEHVLISADIEQDYMRSVIRVNTYDGGQVVEKYWMLGSHQDEKAAIVGMQQLVEFFDAIW